MRTKRIILEIEESLHKRIKDFAIKDKRTLTTILRIMTEEMLEKLIIDKENLINNVVNKPVIKNNDIIETVSNNHKEVTTSLASLTDEELHVMYDRTLTSFELNKIRKDPNYKPDKDVIILNDNEYKEFTTTGKLTAFNNTD